MELISVEIGLASSSASDPPPNCSAHARGVNDHVIASMKPRVASTRRARRARRCTSVSTERVTPCWRGMATGGTVSRPAMRTISSTISAEPCTSGRHVGTVTCTVSPLPSTVKPRSSSVFFAAASLMSRPASFFTRENANETTVFLTGASPATFALDGAPPATSSISRVPRSRPPMMKPGSTPRSKR